MSKPFRSLVLAGIASLGVAGSAFAHAHLKSAIPAANSKMDAPPNELDLTFTEGVDLAFTGVKLAGPGKALISTGIAKLKAGGDTTLVVPLTGTLAAGTYSVTWHALSIDGHKTTGHYSFTVGP